jgi:hypothetical protein
MPYGRTMGGMGGPPPGAGMAPPMAVGPQPPGVSAPAPRPMVSPIGPPPSPSVPQRPGMLGMGGSLPQQPGMVPPPPRAGIGPSTMGGMSAPPPNAMAAPPMREGQVAQDPAMLADKMRQIEAARSLAIQKGAMPGQQRPLANTLGGGTPGGGLAAGMPPASGARGTVPAQANFAASKMQAGASAGLPATSRRA